MFTGIIQAVGRIARLEPCGGDLRLHVQASDLDTTDVAAGDSIAVAGVCLTVVMFDRTGFAADVSRESLSLTTLGDLAPGDPVNLEKALRASDRLGGHLVSGHVDGIARVLSVTPEGRSQRWRFELPSALARHVAGKGSVAIDGTSLTVNDVEGSTFGVNLVPHTLEHTSFQARKSGDAVNIEVDVVARYVARLLEAGDKPGIDRDFLQRHGYT